jgi:hypothetical protein
MGYQICSSANSHKNSKTKSLWVFDGVRVLKRARYERGNAASFSKALSTCCEFIKKLIAKNLAS